MTKSVTVRTSIGISIALLVVVWFSVLYWAISHNALPRLFLADSPIFSHVASFVQYRSAHGLVYDMQWRTSAQEPHYFKLGDLLAAWNPDDTAPSKWLQSGAHPSQGRGLARFDYSDVKQRKVALQYRELELPFIVYNVHELDEAITEAFIPQKLLQSIGKGDIIVERMQSNNYMYYHSKKQSRVQEHFPEWTPPQEDIAMTYPEFLREVGKAEARPDYINSSIPLYYFTISAAEVCMC
jgi:hypothetical protein